MGFYRSLQSTWIQGPILDLMTYGYSFYLIFIEPEADRSLGLALSLTDDLCSVNLIDVTLADESVGDSRVIADSLTTEFSQFGDRLGMYGQS